MCLQRTCLFGSLNADSHCKPLVLVCDLAIDLWRLFVIGICPLAFSELAVSRPATRKLLIPCSMKVMGKIRPVSKCITLRSQPHFRSFSLTTSFKPDHTSSIAHTFTSTKPFSSAMSRMTFSPRPVFTCALFFGHEIHIAPFVSISPFNCLMSLLNWETLTAK